MSPGRSVKRGIFYNKFFLLMIISQRKYSLHSDYIDNEIFRVITNLNGALLLGQRYSQVFSSNSQQLSQFVFTITEDKIKTTINSSTFLVLSFLRDKFSPNKALVRSYPIKPRAFLYFMSLYCLSLVYYISLQLITLIFFVVTSLFYFV